MPLLFAEVDRIKAKTLGVSLDELFGTLQSYLGSSYVNDFNKFGRTWQVKVQADHQFRVRPEDIRSLEVRNANGSMIPVGTLVAVDYRLGPQTILRYNLYPAASITGSASIETLVRVGIEKENGLGPESKMVVLHDFTPCVDDELEVKRGQVGRSCFSIARTENLT